MTRLLFAVAVLSLYAATASRCTSAQDGLPQGAADLILCNAQDSLKLRIEVEFAGESLAKRWNIALGKVFCYFDRDGDGALAPGEAERLPTAFELRQIMWRPSALPSGRAEAVSLSCLDADKNRAVSPQELALYYQARGLGAVVVGVGKTPHTESLTTRLLTLLDSDCDGKVSAPELLAAEELIERVDANNDELASAAELVAGADYPGARGARRLTSIVSSQANADATDCAILIGTGFADDSESGARWIARCDTNKDGSIDGAECQIAPALFASLDVDGSSRIELTDLDALASRPPDCVARLSFSTADDAAPPTLALSGERASTAGSNRWRLQRPSLDFAISAAESRLLERLDDAIARLSAQFVDADANQDGVMDAIEATSPNQYELRGAFHFADRNGDSRLDRDELDAWLEIHRELGQCQALATVLDFGAGLFEAVDANHDGALSRRELRTVADRLATYMEDESLSLSRLPRRVTIAIGRGHPHEQSMPVERSGPEWFVAMDRNRDGDLSAAEFLGGNDTFARFDEDHDGLVSAEEASVSIAVRSD